MGIEPDRILGRTGVKISPLTLGAMNFGRWQEETESIRVDEIVAPGTQFLERDTGVDTPSLQPAALRRTFVERASA